MWTRTRTWMCYSAKLIFSHFQSTGSNLATVWDEAITSHLKSQLNFSEVDGSNVNQNKMFKSANKKVVVQWPTYIPQRYIVSPICILYCFVASPLGHISVGISAKNRNRIFPCTLHTLQKKRINSVWKNNLHIENLDWIGKTWNLGSSILLASTSSSSWFELKYLESDIRKLKIAGKEEILTTNQMSGPHFFGQIFSRPFNILPQSVTAEPWQLPRSLKKSLRQFRFRLNWHCLLARIYL